MREFALLLILLTPLGFAQETDISCKATAVTDGIFVLEGVGGFGGGNVGLLVGERHVVLIDDTMTPTAPALIAVADATVGRSISSSTRTCTVTTWAATPT